jgi:hypothetical protein
VRLSDGLEFSIEVKMTEEIKKLSQHPLAAELLRAYGIISEAAERSKETLGEAEDKSGVHKPLRVMCEK